MKFSVSLSKLYDIMTDEYDVAIDEYMDYEEFVEYVKRYGLEIVESEYGVDVVLDVAEISDVEE